MIDGQPKEGEYKQLQAIQWQKSKTHKKLGFWFVPKS